jgi:hypothetical protein
VSSISLWDHVEHFEVMLALAKLWVPIPFESFVKCFVFNAHCEKNSTVTIYDL